MLKRTADQYLNPKDFWQIIRRLKGTKVQTNPHLNINNRKLTAYEGKEAAHREYGAKSSE